MQISSSSSYLRLSDKNIPLKHFERMALRAATQESSAFRTLVFQASDSGRNYTKYLRAFQVLHKNQ
jgi:hypothetical protein